MDIEIGLFAGHALNEPFALFKLFDFHREVKIVHKAGQRAPQYQVADIVGRSRERRLTNSTPFECSPIAQKSGFVDTLLP
jgi:hypothetical protein